MSLRFGLTRASGCDSRIDDRERVVRARIGEHQRLGFALDQAVHHALHLDDVRRCDLLFQVIDIALRVDERLGAHELIGK